MLIERAVAAEPENAAYLDSLGWAHFRQQNFPEAIKFLKQANELRPDDGVLLEHLGDAYFGDQQKKKGIANWKKALDFYQQDEDQERLSQLAEKLKKHDVKQTP